MQDRKEDRIASGTNLILNFLSHKGRMTMMIAIVLASCKLQICRSYVKIYCLCLEQRGEDEQRTEREGGKKRKRGRGGAIAGIVCLFWGLAISFTLGAGGLLFFALSSTGFGLLARRH